MGQPAQAAGTAAESSAAVATNGFVGWTPEASRSTYVLASANKKGAAEVNDTATRRKQFYR